MNLDVRYADRLKAIDGVEDAIPVGRYLIQGTTGIGLEQIDGVDWESYAHMNDIRIVAGNGPAGPNEAMIDEVKARNDKLHVGDQIKPFGTKVYRIAGIYWNESDTHTNLKLARLQETLELTKK